MMITLIVHILKLFQTYALCLTQYCEYTVYAYLTFTLDIRIGTKLSAFLVVMWVFKTEQNKTYFISILNTCSHSYIHITKKYTCTKSVIQSV